MSASRLEIASRLRALLPHVTSDPEAEVFLDSLIQEYGGKLGGGYALDTAGTSAAGLPPELIGKWAWYETEGKVIGPFDSREAAIASIQEHANEGAIEFPVDVQVGQYAPTDLADLVPEGDTIAEYLIDMFTDAPEEDSSFEAEHEVDVLEVNAGDAACRTLEAFVKQWAHNHVEVITPKWVIKPEGGSVEDEINWPSEED
jgi:hypothetical protein